MTSEWKISPTGDEVKTKKYACPFPNCTFEVEYEVAYKDPGLHATRHETLKGTITFIREHYREQHQNKGEFLP